MKTTVLDEKDLHIAAQALKEGKLVVFPTETVYGLGANGLDEEACRGIYKAKGRPSDNPLILHVDSKDMIERLALDISEDTYKLIDAFWPGPLTVILKKQAFIPDVVTGGLDTVALRMPSGEIALELIKLAGIPVAAPSANLSGKPSPTSFSHVYEDLSGRVDYIINGPDTQVGIESTVIDMSQEIPTILRPGIITKQQIEKVIGRVLIDDHLKDESQAPKSPGMKYRHYAPEGKLTIYQGDNEKVVERINYDLKLLSDRNVKVAVITFDENYDRYDILKESLGSKERLHESAARLFGILRKFDKMGIEHILSESIPLEGEGYSVMNRLLKASGNNIINVD